MIAIFRTPARRISLAIALSLAIHAVVLWLPYMQLPQADLKLSTLSVRLEPLPEPVEMIATKTVHAKPKSEHPSTASGTSASTESSTMAPMDRTEETTDVQPFPHHMLLSFIVYKDRSRTGEMLQQLDIHGKRYSLKSLRKTSGLASLRNNDQLTQTSRGKFDEHGLQPEIYEEEGLTQSGKQSVKVTFDRSAHKLHYSSGAEEELPADAQDSLSFMYQLSQMPMDEELLEMPVSDGVQLRQYQIEIGTKEDITTPLGKLHTLHLRQMHASGEAYFEIWLGLEYRLLPVKFSEVDGAGNVTEEFEISEIRSDDE